MAKQKTTKVSVDEDMVIGNGLSLVREGLVNNDWGLVYEGYNLISGKDLQPKEESRLDRIRKNIKNNKEDPLEEPVVNAVEETVDGKLIITGGFSETESKINAKIAKRNPRLPIQRTAPPKDNSTSDKSVRFYDNPPKTA